MRESRPRTPFSPGVLAKKNGAPWKVRRPVTGDNTLTRAVVSF